MSEIEHEIQQEAAEVAAEVGGTAGAIAAEHVAAHAAEQAVEQAVEHVEELVEHVEELVDDTKEDERWARMQAAQLESEQRIIAGVSEAVTRGLQSLSLSPLPTTEPTTTPDPAATLEEISEELSETAEELDDGGAEPATFDPLGVEDASPPDAKSRRRLVGRGRRQSA